MIFSLATLTKYFLNLEYLACVKQTKVRISQREWYWHLGTLNYIIGLKNHFPKVGIILFKP
jgi:hypothetical protein